MRQKQRVDFEEIKPELYENPPVSFRLYKSQREHMLKVMEKLDLNQSQILRMGLNLGLSYLEKIELPKV